MACVKPKSLHQQHQAINIFAEIIMIIRYITSSAADANGEILIQHYWK